MGYILRHERLTKLIMERNVKDVSEKDTVGLENI